MTTWTRAAMLIRCGLCGHEIPVGAPLFTMRLSVVSQPKRRCATCAGEPVPAELPPVIQSVPLTPFLKLPSGPGVLPFDYKAAASGEREVGEDG